MTFEVVERRYRRQRLVAERVEDRAAQRTLAQRAEQGALVDEPAARDVDQPRAGLHHGQRLVVDHVLGLGGERRGQDDEVRLAQELRQRLRPTDAIEHRLAERPLVAVVATSRPRPTAPPAAPALAPGRRRTATTRHPKAVASAPTARPIEPSPTMPDRHVAQLRTLEWLPRPLRCSSRSCGSRRLTARIIISTYSAIGRLNTPRAFVTTTPRSRAAGVRARSTPDVAEWTHDEAAARGPAADRTRPS